MDKELKNWIEDRLKNRDPIGLDTDNFRATSAFGMRSENNQLFDFAITFKRNKAIIRGEWDVIEDAISFRDNSWDASRLENLVSHIIQRLQEGGRFQLNRTSVDPHYHINGT